MVMQPDYLRTVRLLSDRTALRIFRIHFSLYCPCHKVLGNAAVRSLNNRTVQARRVPSITVKSGVGRVTEYFVPPPASLVALGIHTFLEHWRSVVEIMHLSSA